MPSEAGARERGAAELAAQTSEFGLFIGAERAHQGCDSLRMGGEDARDEAAAGGGQGDAHASAILGAAGPPDHPAAFEVVEDDRDIAAAAQELAGELALVHRAEMKESLEDAELSGGKAFASEGAGEDGGQGFGGAGELDVGIEGPRDMWIALETRAHRRFQFK